MGFHDSWSIPKKKSKSNKIKAWDSRSSPGWWYVHETSARNHSTSIFWLNDFCFITFVVFCTPLSLIKWSSWSDTFSFMTFPSFVEVVNLKRFKPQPQHFIIYIYIYPTFRFEATISLGGHFSQTQTVDTHHLSKKKPPAARHHGSSWSAFCRGDLGADFSCQALGTCLVSLVGNFRSLFFLVGIQNEEVFQGNFYPLKCNIPKIVIFTRGRLFRTTILGYSCCFCGGCHS